MKRVIKITLISALILILMWTTLVIIDAVRLYYSSNYTKPLITVTKTTSKDNITFIGLGYSINYNKPLNILSHGSDYVSIEITEVTTTFRLFNKLTIWEK